MPLNSKPLFAALVAALALAAALIVPTTPLLSDSDGGGVGAKPAKAAATAVTPARPTDIVVSTFNVYVKSSVAKQNADLTKLLTTRTNIIGFQEASNSYRNLKAVLASHGWGYYQPSVNSELSIGWDKRRFTLVTPGTVAMMRGGDKTHTRHKHPNRYTANVRLMDNVTKQTVSMYDTHMNQHIEAGGMPRNGESNWPNAAVHLEWLENRMALDTAGVVILVGDLHIDARGDHAKQYYRFPLKTLGTTAVSNWQALGTSGAGTHGNRFIDYVYMARTTWTNWYFAQDFVLGGFYSDHNPVMAIIRQR